MRGFLVVLALLGGCMPVEQRATLVSRFVWAEDAPEFGGFSGITVLDGGTGFIALNDKGRVWQGALLRENGQIVGVDSSARWRLRDADGRPLVQDFNDSEGLARLSDGSIAISFEGMDPRVAIYTDLAAAPAFVLRTPDFERFVGNNSLESVAVDTSGAIYTIPERSGRAQWPFPVYKFADGVAEIAFTIPRRGAFLVVGADIGPDGLLYVLERDFTGLGFRSRVRRFNLSGGAEEMLLQSRNGQHDNLEGISVWQDSDGGLIMTLIADDNFKFFQRTEFVEYRIDG